MATEFAPFYRSTIGIDRLAQIFDNVQRADSQPSYPPYNIELVAENKYRITMAVAGFDSAELEIVTERDLLTITGRKQAEEQRNFLHRGIATRNFERRFQLTDHVQVVSASFENGMLNVDLVREVPEALKPRKIAINAENVHRLERAAA
ncbi:MAG TPA: Hsp20 family protein [Herbaspirillum sp.]|jgi:molecular chaperone IbpA